MPPRSVLLLLLLSLFATFTFAKPAWHLIETEDGEGDAREDFNNLPAEDKQTIDREIMEMFNGDVSKVKGSTFSLTVSNFLR